MRGSSSGQWNNSAAPVPTPSPVATPAWALATSGNLCIPPTGHAGNPVNTPTPGNHESLQARAARLPACWSLRQGCAGLSVPAASQAAAQHTQALPSTQRVSTALGAARGRETELPAASAGTQRDPGERWPWVMGRFVLSEASQQEKLRGTKQSLRGNVPPTEPSWHDHHWSLTVMEFVASRIKGCPRQIPLRSQSNREGRHQGLTPLRWDLWSNSKKRAQNREQRP